MIRDRVEMVNRVEVPSREYVDDNVVPVLCSKVREVTTGQKAFDFSSRFYLEVREVINATLE